MDIKEAPRNILVRMNALLRQLSEKAQKISKEDLKKILMQEMLLAHAFKGNLFIGMASIHFRQTLIRKVGIIEDVVTDKNYRGKGIGRKLTEMLIEEAKKRRAEYIELTSNPKRKAAIALYKKLGFKLIAKAVGKNGTNLYRLYL